MSNKRSAYLHVAWLFPLLLFALGLSLLTGSFELGIGDVWSAIFDHEHSAHNVIWGLRMPRALLAAIAGAILSVGGFYIQGIVRNPLADPYIMGLTAGAGLGVNLGILGIIPLSLGLWTYPVLASLGAMLSLLLLLVLGFRSLENDSNRLLIAGVAVSAILTAITGFLIYRFAADDQVRKLVFWTFGSLNRADWPAVQISSVALIGAMLYGIIQGRRLDVLMLGDATAQSLGLSTRNFKLGLLFVASLSVGAVVAFTGPIGFVGMMIPHACRSLFGLHHRSNVILAALLGAAFLPICDALGRQLFPPAGLPIGIITAILGVPFFLYVLFSGKRFWA
ncbi:MAG: FecCD family ABC transporter permease [Bacteroidia bacterium]